MMMQYNHGEGLSNDGNTCFANAGVQLIACSKVLRDFLREHEDGAFRGDVEAELALLVRGLQEARERGIGAHSEHARGHITGSTRSSARSSTALLKAVREYFPDEILLQKVGVQFDPGEFVQLLLKAIPGLARKCVVEVKSATENCPACQILTPELRDANSLHVNIKMFAKNENTANIIQTALSRKKKFRCGMCTHRSEAFVKHSSVLVLEIERRTSGRRNVNKQNVICSLVIAIDSRWIWKLQGVISFEGEDNSGHCTLYRVDHISNTLQRLSDATSEKDISLDYLKTGTIVASVVLYERTAIEASLVANAFVSVSENPTTDLAMATARPTTTPRRAVHFASGTLN